MKTLRSAPRCRCTLPAALAITAVALGGGTARAFDLRHDGSGALVRWQAPLTFTVDDSVAQQLGGAEALPALQAAADELNRDQLVPRITLTPGAAGRSGFDPTPGAANANEIIAVTDWPAGREAVASTIVTIDRRSHRILDADILLNVSERDLGVVPASGGAPLYDLQGAVTHELGHALGLMHTEVEGAVMYPKTFKGDVSKRTMQQDDLEGLAALYGAGADEEQAPPVGCSSTGAGAGALALGILPLLFAPRRRRAAAVVAACLVAGAALAGEPAAPTAVKAVTGRVVAVSTSWVEGQAGVLVTHVTLQVGACSEAPCEPFVVVPVLGGTSGDVEQVVDGQPAPHLGETLGVVFRGGGTRGELFDLDQRAARTRFFTHLAAR